MTAAARPAIESALGHRFARPERLETALTHRSYGIDAANNETLEFLGDAVLALAVSDLLMERFPMAREGDLSKLRASLVNAETLASKARSMDLGRWLRVGKGEEKSGGRDKERLLASGYEAVLGAVYLDAGYEAARRVIAAHFAADLVDDAIASLRDWKTQLQEATQRLYRETPVYTLAAEIGPDHDKRFVVEIAIGGRTYASGEGRSKKLAEQAAARAALAVVGAGHGEP